MTYRETSLILKLVNVAAAVACIVVAVVVIPQLEQGNRLPLGATPAFALGILPLLAVALTSWRLFSRIAQGELFSKENAYLLRLMSYFAAADALLWLVLLVAYLVAVSPVAFSVVASLSVALIFAISLTVIAAALSLFTTRASSLKDENDLVI